MGRKNVHGEINKNASDEKHTLFSSDSNQISCRFHANKLNRLCSKHSTGCNSTIFEHFKCKQTYI